MYIKKLFLNWTVSIVAYICFCCDVMIFGFTAIRALAFEWLQILEGTFPGFIPETITRHFSKSRDWKSFWLSFFFRDISLSFWICICLTIYLTVYMFVLVICKTLLFDLINFNSTWAKK